MKSVFFVLSFLFLTDAANSQFTLYKSVDGVEFYTKWGNEKWWSKKSPAVLLVKVKNTNKLTINYTLGVEFFKNLQLVESSNEENYCLGALSKATPRIKGLVFKPSVESAVTSIDSFELSGLKIEKLTIEECPKEK